MKARLLAMLMAAIMALSCLTALAETTEATDAAETIEIVETGEGVEYEGGWWNILLMGGDSRSKGGYARTDCMIIFSVNREESLVKMTSVMRDTWVEIPGHGNGKINAANVYGGPELAMQVVSDSFDVDIHNYVLVNMYGLVNIIDKVGGVTIDVTESERQHTNNAVKEYLSEISSYSGDTYLSNSGTVHLNGLLAMSFCRNRSTDNDYGRVMRQQKVLLGLAESMQNMEINDLMKMTEDFTTGTGMETDLTNEQLKELATAALATEIEEVGQNRIPADGTFDSGMFSGTWMIRPNFEKNAELLHEFIYGE